MKNDSYYVQKIRRDVEFIEKVLYIFGGRS